MVGHWLWTTMTAALHGLIEDVRQAHFELTDGETVVVAGGSIRRGHRPGQSV